LISQKTQKSEDKTKNKFKKIKTNQVGFEPTPFWLATEHFIAALWPLMNF
jgi:hypothetical protein